MDWQEMLRYREEELRVQVTGREPLRPILSFTHAGFSDTLLKEIIKRGFEAPTPIQAQALPLALSGRDLVGIAKTGSGKTLAFVWPVRKGCVGGWAFLLFDAHHLFLMLHTQKHPHRRSFT